MVAVAVVATSVGVTCTGPGARRFMLFRASDTCLATMSEIFEVKQSSVKKERVFHTQECKMLHNSAEILFFCIRISKF